MTYISTIGVSVQVNTGMILLSLDCDHVQYSMLRIF